ncbi:capsule assembly Wzi family protein [Geothrix terrae]|uniref:capsule assembly Wzi family protein n=1 Tax=Geothrix terrae TaxID=2922720 RepID=UPI001FAC43BC|nr:capsule assembly Wzi family protein [Geothrix terrae]
MRRWPFHLTVMSLATGLCAQAPVLQDGATALRQAQRTWTTGEEPLPPLALPSLEVGLGGAGSEGRYAPLVGGEGLGRAVEGWGLGLQGRYVSGGWSVAATALGLRVGGMTRGYLLRAAIAYRWESGWRLALEQQPFDWGAGFEGGDLLGDAARPFPRLSWSTPEASLPFGRGRAEAFAGRLEADRPIPDWIPDRGARLAAQAGGLDLRRPWIYGGMLRAAFGSVLEASLGSVRMEGGEDPAGRTAPASSARTWSLAEVKVRIPVLARFVGARGAAIHLSRSAAPDNRALTLTPARSLGGLQLVWDRWDVGLEYAGAGPSAPSGTFSQPAYLAGSSTFGDPLGAAFGREAITRTVELGMPLFLEGQGRLRGVRGTSASPLAPGFWFLQGEAQWRTPTGRIGASLASRRDEVPGSSVRWGWTFSLFQSFRVF